MPKSPKRKRRQSEDTTATGRTNPFLIVSQEDADEDKAQILQWMLFFVDHSRQNSLADENDLALFKESVAGLVRVLEDSEEEYDDDSIKNPAENIKKRSHQKEVPGYASEIARLLFPWALQQLGKLLDGNLEILVSEYYCWSAFRFALSRFLTLGESPPLTQSILFKMAPRLAKLAVDEKATKHSREQAAEVFQVLLSHELFTPTLDVAVETVLLPLAHAMKLSDAYTSRRILPSVEQGAVLSSQRSYAMLQTTLQWIHARLINHGNPKSNFGVVARKPVLLALSQIHLLWQAMPEGRLLFEVEYGQDLINRQVLQRIIYDGLVAPHHHIDGFKSLSVSSTFACYQNDLLQTISAMLRDKSIPNNARDMAWLLPVFLRNFLQASRVWYQDQPPKYKKKAPPLSALQFAIFERLAAPLLETLNGEVTDLSIVTVGLRALREMLDLVDEFQAYVPAHDTKDQPQFGFLQKVGTFLLQRQVDPGTFSGLEQYADTILLITRLVKLNHLLWREKWQVVLRLAYHSSDARLHVLLCTLLRVATETFTQLRQVDTWIKILFEVSESLDNESQSEILADILTEASVEQALAQHVQSCPVTQIPQVFLFIQQALTCPDQAILSTVIQPIVTTVLRSFKVDPGTVDTVSLGLQQLMESTVGDMVISDRMAVRNVSIEVCGWCIDLSMRCSFWLGHSAQVQIPVPLQRAMEQNAEGDELLLVTAHRLRQISSLLHEASLSQVRQESSSTKEIKNLQKEAKRLATHLYTKACSMVSGRGWTLIAQFLQFWIPYANQSQVVGFLGWLSAVLSLDSSSDEVPSCFLVPPAGDMAHQREIAQSLLLDDAFHDLAIINENLPFAATKVAAQWIILSISGSSEKDEASGYLSDVDEIMGLRETDFSSEWGAVNFEEALASVERDFAERCLCCATEMVRVLNGLPSKGLNRLHDICLPLLYLDRLVCDRYLDNLDARFYVTAVSLSTALREALHRNLNLDHSANVSATLKFLQGSLGRCSLSSCSGGPDEKDQLYFKLTGNIVQELCGASHQSSEYCDSILTEWFDSLLPPVKRDHGRAPGSDKKKILDVGAVESFLILHTLQSISDSKSTNTTILTFCDRVIERYMQLFDTNAVASWGSITMCKIITEALLLKDHHSSSPGNTVTRERLIDVCLRWLGASSEIETCLEILISLLALDMPLSGNQLSQILRAVIVLERGQAMIPPIVCTCIRKVTSDGLGEFIEYAVGLERKGMSTRLLLIRLFFSVAFLSADQNDLLDGHKDRLLDFALHSIQQIDGRAPDMTPAAMEIWIQAVQNGHSIKREKLVVLLGRIAQVLGPGERSMILYTSCARLLALLLQRYSKHLSACAPVVVLVLQSLLRQLIDVNLSTQDLSLRARHWTRLCELLVPQKEVYKKHLVHILLESLRAAEDGDVKQALMPGWMYLLDTFSPSYELKQLNALMEDTSIKMRFRPIYEQYRRHHAYQGH
eukprot:scaffold8927_cov176-Amphora_coffeaeformis.AAC.7